METISAKRGMTFSDALQQVGFGKFNVFLIVMGGIILANVVLEIGAVGFILPLVECDLKLSHTDKGLLSAISFVGVIMSSHLWGFLADTKGRRAVIMPTLLISSLVTFLASFSDRFWILLLLRFTTGFFTSAASATIFAYVGEFHVQRIRSRAIMTSSFTLSVAAILWPLIAWGVINQSWSLPMPFLGIVYKPWRLFMVVFGVPGFVCAIAMIFCPESPQFLLSVGKEKEAIHVLKRMHKWNGGAQELEITELIPDAETTVRDVSKTSGTNFLSIFLRTMWQQTVPLFQTGFLKGTLVICVIQFVYHIALHGFFVWFPYIVDAVMGFDEPTATNSTHICDKLYAKQRHSYKLDGTTHCGEKLDESTFIYTVVMEVLCTAEYAVILIIINRVRKVRITMAIFIVCGACGLAAIHVPSPAVAIWLYALMLMASNVYHLLAGIVVELYPTHLRGMALCIALLVSRVGGVVGGNLSGLLLEYNCEIAFSLSGSLLVVCGLLMLLIPRHLRPKKAEIELNS